MEKALALLTMSLLILSSLSILSVSSVNCLVEEIPEPPVEEPETFQPFLDQTGTYFELGNGVTVTSSATVHIVSSASPEMTEYHIESADGSISTTLTLSNLGLSTNYFMYEDGYHNENAFTTDDSGSYTYTQDLSQRHHVFIQTEPGTLLIYVDTMLTSDVYESVEIMADDIVLDLNGHSIIGSDSGYGIYLNERTGVTIKNGVVENFVYGIFLEDSSSNTISDNTFTDNMFFGINLDYSSSNDISNNVVTNNNLIGIYLYSSSSNTISNNVVTNNNLIGIFLSSSSSNTIRDNVVTNNNDYGIFLYSSGDNILRTNSMSGNTYNFGVLGYSLSEFIQDIDTSNTVDGKPIYYWVNQKNREVPKDAGYVGIVDSKGIIVKDLTLTNNLQGVLFAYTTKSIIENVYVSNNNLGIDLYYSSSNTISENVVTNNNDGIYLEGFSDSNTIRKNVVTNNNHGIYLYYSSSNTVRNNVVTNNDIGINLHSSSSNDIRNNVVTNNDIGINLHSSSSNDIRNNVVTNNDIGINLHSSSSNTIRDNVVINSKNYGIYLYYSSSNKIYHNNIIDNTVQAYDYGGTGNSWDDGYPSGGNYWSDYPSVDYYRGPNQDQPGSDGIGDTPYLFEYNQDNYPLMEPY